MTVVWSMKELREDLPNWSHHDVVAMTQKNQEPETYRVEISERKVWA